MNRYCFALLVVFFQAEITLLSAAEPAAADHAIVQAMMRIPEAELSDFTDQKDALLRYLDSIQDDRPQEFVKIVRQLKVKDRPDQLQQIMLQSESDQSCIDAAGLLLEFGHQEVLVAALNSSDDAVAAKSATTLSHVSQKSTAQMLMTVMMDGSRNQSVRSAAATGLARNWFGQKMLLEMARKDQVPEELKFEISDGLLGSWTKEVAEEAKTLKSLAPAAATESKPIPPINQLIQMRGDGEAGKQVFETTGTCAKCHQVNGQGKEVGPDLSEIGSKLSRIDLYVNILNPSAAISHNYETYALLTVDGAVVNGILVSQTDESVTIKTADAVLRTIPSDQIETLKKQSVSLMPADLHKLMTVQNLLDLVDYLVLLKKDEESAFHVLASSEVAGSDSRRPEDALAGLDTAKDVQVQLFAAEPMMLSPTSIDVDHLSRVWVCEAVNYRHFRNPYNEPREQGDRILVMEDTNKDGAADKTTVFYQGSDIDSPHGICVLGDRVIVSAGEQVIEFVDHDGDLKPDSKRSLFTGIAGVQHDHGIHSFMPGPDGKLYFNFGNAGKQLKTSDGKPVVDRAGNVVDDTRNPYQQGMVFRCDSDGSNVETLGWNFRNNWEVCVDSFGTMWQSDNDDDGNRGVRINYVMEFGNYGYRNELTGSSWQTPRIGMRQEIGERHWHLNDPGVVPNVLQTGAGSPTGMAIYEGNLLPHSFRGQMIHCDPGPNVVRAYPVTEDGAGYRASIANLVKGTRDQWFRPVDVCTAPDGSLIVADWYDPGVGGHRMGDASRGRLFRVTVPAAEKYRCAAPDFESISGALNALKSPNQSTRYLAGEALQKHWAKHPPNVPNLLSSEVSPRQRARLFWQLAWVPGKGAEAIDLAGRDQDANLRVAAVRAARQHDGVDTIDLVKRLLKDESPQVRKELAIALRGNESADAAGLWVELAIQHDGNDRWYLEALGIGADGQWDRFFAAWLERVGDGWSDMRNRDLIWRARTPAACEYLAKIIHDCQDVREQERYFRAFDFLKGEQKTSALTMILKP